MEQEALAGKEAAEQKAKELEATHAHSTTASAEMSGRAELAESQLAKKEEALSETRAALKASQEAVRALDAEKVRALSSLCATHLHLLVYSAWSTLLLMCNSANCMVIILLCALCQAAALKEVEKLSTELSNLQKVNENFEKMQKELHAATEALKNRADKSEATLKKIQTSLEAAEASAASSQKALKAVCSPH